MAGAAETMSRVGGVPVPVDVVDSFDETGLVEPDLLRERGPLANSIASRMMGSSQEVDQRAVVIASGTAFDERVSPPLPDDRPVDLDRVQGRPAEQLTNGGDLATRTQGAPIPLTEPRPPRLHIGTDGRAHVE
jgi:hypothetical protein